MEQHTSNPTKDKESCYYCPTWPPPTCSSPATACRLLRRLAWSAPGFAKPSPSYINLQANSLPATFLNIQTTKLPSGAGQKPKECLGLLECMSANLQLQTQLAQQQMAILENLEASLSQLGPGRESNNGSFPALCYNLLLNHLPQFHK